MEGASLSTAAPQVPNKGNKPKCEERPLGELSGFVTIHDDETASESDKTQYIRYLEQRNKQLEDQNVIIELQNICENHQAAQHREIEFTSLEQQVNEDREANLERVNIYLEEWLKRADRDHALLKRMVIHYKVQNLVCKARIRSLKAKLRKMVKKQKRQKELDHLQILEKASLAHHNT